MDVTRDYVAEALGGTKIVDIGQIGPADVRKLQKAVRTGTLVAFRDHWYPYLAQPKACWCATWAWPYYDMLRTYRPEDEQKQESE